ncbi:MAG: 2-oxo acid dehydrogenase subunit E2 [Chitinivibrionales bacterium]|nr:2-oxo acid dehydrogenase subunit E2 [Chitinivibrionales bacterium]
MKKNIVVPEMGESVSKGIIVAWLKKNGDAVNEGEPLFELETDKATVAVPATAAGILEILVQKESEVKIGQVVATIESKDTVPASTALTQPAAAPQERAPETQAQTIAAAPDEPGQTRVAMTPLRKKTAERLVLARREAVYVTTFNEIDLSKVAAIRSHFAEGFEKDHGIKIGFMSFFVKASCKALAVHRELNARVEGDEIVYNNFYNIGVAISLDRGLIVPVVRNADALTFAEIEKAIAGLAKRARDKQLGPDELQGGTFTITNGGVFGSLMSTPVPAYPQAAILGMHAIKKRPVVVDDAIVIRPMMYVALTYDHRIVDGRDAIGFLVKVKEFIEEPDALLLEM